MKHSLFRSKQKPGYWICFDEYGNLTQWPDEPKGWARRTAFTGDAKKLEPVPPALSRGTGKPGGPRGRRPRQADASEVTLGVRLTKDELARLRHAAKDEGREPSVLVRELIEEYLNTGRSPDARANRIQP